MAKLICPQYCPVPFCETACPSGAITSVVKEKKSMPTLINAIDAEFAVRCARP